MDEAVLHPTFVATRPGSVDLPPGDVHIWAVPLHGDAESYGALLSPAEQHRLQRFHFADHRRRYQIGHGALRLILAGYLDEEPAALSFTQGPRGKPYLASRGPFFNLSHSGKLALIGVSATELGVDLEKVRHLESLTEIARKHFSADEFAALDRLEGAAREQAFYRCWTRKEAYIKALGEGLSMPLDSFDVSLDEAGQLLRCRDRNDDPARWSLLDVSPGPEFVAACALRAQRCRLRAFRLVSERGP